MSFVKIQEKIAFKQILPHGSSQQTNLGWLIHHPSNSIYIFGDFIFSLSVSGRKACQIMSKMSGKKNYKFRWKVQHTECTSTLNIVLR